MGAPDKRARNFCGGVANLSELYRDRFLPNTPGIASTRSPKDPLPNEV